MTWLLMGWKGIQGAFGFIARYPWQAAVLALCVACAWQAAGKHRLASDNKALATRIIAQKAEFVAASEAAKAKAEAQRIATENRYRTLAQETDHEAQTALVDARSRANTYARRMSAKTLCVPSSGSTTPADGGGPKGGDRSGADAVILSRHDFDVMVENSVRLKAVHDWALTLNVEPIPSPAF